MTEGGKFRRGRRWLAGIAAAVLILLAVVVGVARLLLPMAPEYQDEIRRIASEATGFDVRFGRLSATWPISGPEIQLYEVRIATLDGGHPVLAAGELSVGVSLWQLIVEQRLRPGRIAVSGASMRIEHLPSGEWQLNGVPLDKLLRQPSDPEMPRLDLRLEDIALVAVDPARLESTVKLHVEQCDLNLAPDLVRIKAHFNGEDGLGNSIELTGELPSGLLRQRLNSGTQVAQSTGPAVDWNLNVAGKDLDIARWLRVVVNQPVPLMSGRGALELNAGFSGTVPREISINMALGPTRWAGLTDTQNNYQSLNLRGPWVGTSDGWEATLGRFAAERDGQVAPAATGRLRFTRATKDPASIEAAASALRLQDLWPVLRSFASSGLQHEVLPALVQGTVDNLQLSASLPADAPPTYKVEAKFRTRCQDAGARLGSGRRVWQLERQ
ncbi:MAG: hypothetical protein R3F24_08580 [Gammaproteobacteria bacterium]